MTSAPDSDERRAAVEALDLLAHWWCRPDLGEIQMWEEARGLESELRLRFASSVDPGDEHGFPRTLAESLELLAEHERLFVGPGAVPCPPYEWYWLDDGPFEVRRDHGGPRTKELRLLYHRLGLELEPASQLPDHIAVELEALAYALSLEVQDDIAEEILEAHLAKWIGAFCRAVAGATGHPFYSGLAELTLRWVAAVRSMLALSLGPARDRPA